MIINPDDVLTNAYICTKSVKDYLVYQCNLPILGIDNRGKYYFSRSEELIKYLKDMPLGIKIKAFFEKA